MIPPSSVKCQKRIGGMRVGPVNALAFVLAKRSRPLRGKGTEPETSKTAPLKIHKDAATRVTSAPRFQGREAY